MSTGKMRTGAGEWSRSGSASRWGARPVEGSVRNMGYSWSEGAGWELVKKRIVAGGQGALRREKGLKKVSWLQ